MTENRDLTVRSHVGRDLLQSAAVFRSDRKVVWEYVANSLQYTDARHPPAVAVHLNERTKTILITDNGRGMDLADLQHFFTMHAENRERLSGRIGRGLFGTGKSAAFGIADILQVTSVKDGLRSAVRLRRSEIENMIDGRPVPVEVREVEEPTDEHNGTKIQISGIHLKKIDRAGIIAYIERHLARYPRDVEVFVDHHECRFKTPEEAESYEFRTTDICRIVLGDVRLIIKVAKGPLEEDLRGVQVFSYGNWHATTLAGCEGSKMSEYIFGEIDVPNLEDYGGPIRPFDNTRSGELNPNNPVVEALFAFVGPAVETVRRQLLDREGRRAQEEEARKLAKEAARIAEILTADFAEIAAKIRKARAIATGKQDGEAGNEDGIWSQGGDIPAMPAELPPGERERKDSLDDPRPFAKPVVPEDNGQTTGQRGTGSGTKRSKRGGFNVEYKNAGEAEYRALFVPDHRTILINLDHPQIAAAYRSGGIENPAFTRLTWEVASSEYALALSQEVAEPYTSPEEALFEVRETMDRVSRRLASLYRPDVFSKEG